MLLEYCYSFLLELKLFLLCWKVLVVKPYIHGRSQEKLLMMITIRGSGWSLHDLGSLVIGLCLKSLRLKIKRKRWSIPTCGDEYTQVLWKRRSSWVCTGSGMEYPRPRISNGCLKHLLKSQGSFSARDCRDWFWTESVVLVYWVQNGVKTFSGLFSLSLRRSPMSLVSFGFGFRSFRTL